MVLASVFLYRLLSIPAEPGSHALPRDHFYHLSRARQTLLGEMPIRDFYEPGHFLRVYASAALQGLFGHHLLAEVLLCVGLTSAGSALLFVLARSLARSSLIALFATILAVAMGPDLHDYPKIFLLPLALFCSWRYLDHPTQGNLALLALCTSLAFLFRHDYLVYGGLLSIATLLLSHWGAGGRVVAGRAALWALWASVPLVPFLCFVQVNGGILRYFQASADYVQAHGVGLTAHTWSPWATVAVGTPVIKVRWREGLSPETQATLEARYGLANGRPFKERTWEYDLTDASRANIGDIVEDKRLSDTSGLDRVRWRVAPDDGEAVVRLSLSPPEWPNDRLLSLTLAPHAPYIQVLLNPTAWLAGIILVLPGIGLLVVLLAWRRARRRGEAPSPQLPRVLVLLVLTTVANRVLLRAVDVPHLAAAFAVTVPLVAWLVRQLLDWAGATLSVRSRQTESLETTMSRAGLARFSRVSLVTAGLGVAAAVVVLSGMSVLTISPAEAMLERTGIVDGPMAVGARSSKVVSALLTAPTQTITASPDSGWSEGVLYLAACTRPADRVLLATDQPVYDFYFYSNRGFAAGRMSFDPGQFARVDDLETTLDRLQHQSVPIALLDVRGRSAFENDFGPVYRHLLANYQVAGEFSVGDGGRQQRVYQVLADRRSQPTGVHGPNSLPCFA